MSNRRASIIIGSVIAALAVSCFVSWNTRLGRAVRGVSAVAVVNRSAAPLQSVSVHLTDSQGRQVDRRFEHLQPQASVRVDVHTSDLIVRRIVCQQGQREFIYDEGASVTPGEVFLVTVDARGKVTSEYEH
jgi:hypothetical protein